MSSSRAVGSDEGDWVDYTMGAVGTPNGNVGQTGVATECAGGAGFALAFEMASGTYGAGGGAYGSPGGCGPVGGAVSGSSGGYLSTYVDVVPGTDIEITVGKRWNRNYEEQRRTCRY